MFRLKIKKENVDSDLSAVDFVPTEDRGCHVTNQVVLRQISLFWAVSDLLDSTTFVSRTMVKSLKWIELQEENYLAPFFAKIQAKHK